PSVINDASGAGTSPIRSSSIAAGAVTGGCHWTSAVTFPVPMFSLSQLSTMRFVRVITIGQVPLDTSLTNSTNLTPQLSASSVIKDGTGARRERMQFTSIAAGVVTSRRV